MEGTRESWGLGAAQDLKADLLFGWRQLRKNPAFTAVAALTLALGIGGTVALFSAVHGLMLRPLPFADEDRLVYFWSGGNWRGIEFDFVTEHVQAYDQLAAYSSAAEPFRNEDATSLLELSLTSAELFDVLGARPLLGRTFEPGEDRPGAEPVIVLSYGLWQQELGGDPGVVGQRITLGGVPTTVIGVMPEGFYFPTPQHRAWRPLVLDPATRNYQGNGYLRLIGRVKASVSPAQLEQDVGALATALGERFTYPEAWDKTKGAHVVPLREHLLGDVRPALLLLLGAVGLLLLLACANVTALILTRTTDRVSEMAVRAALGAGRGRLARQVLTESLLLGTVSGALAIAVAVGLFDLLVARLPLQSGFGETLSLDWPMFLGAPGLALAAGCAVAIVPIWNLLRGRLEGELTSHRSQGGAARGTSRAQGALVVAEVLLAVMLVAGATLLIRTVTKLQDLDPGFDPTGVLAIELVASEQDMRDSELRAFYDELVQRAAALPGVRAAGLTNRLPIRDGGWQSNVTIESRPDLAAAKRPNSLWRIATPDYFRAMGIAARQGRAFDATDRAGGLGVIVVSESFAARMWPGADPIGQRVQTGFEGSPEWLTVVGVVAETRMFSMLGENPMVMYRPQAQRVSAGVSNNLVLKTDLDPVQLVGPVRDLVRQLDSRVAFARVSTMEGVIAASIAEPLRLRFFLMLFAGLGLLLGSVGVYGVVSYSVSRRRGEFGIRMALGASPAAVLAAVVKKGMIPVVMGTLAGVAASLALSTLVAGFLFEIDPTDPASLGLAASVLLLAGIAAAFLPAYRAGRVSPLEALRAE